MNKSVLGALLVLLATTVTATLAITPTAGATSYLCQDNGINQKGGTSTFCTVYVYEGNNLICVMGFRDSTPGQPYSSDTYSCLLSA